MWGWLKAAANRISFVRQRTVSMVAEWLANALWLIDTSFLNLAKTAYGSNAIAYSCLRLLSQSIPEAPLKAYQEDTKGERTEIDRQHPLYSLIHHPNELQTEYEFWELTTLFLAHAGIAPWWKQRAVNGQIIALWPLRPDRVGPIYSDSDKPGERLLLGYSYQDPGTGAYIPLARRDVVCFNLPNPAGESGGAVEGLGPLQVLSNEIAVDNEATAFVGALVKNYAVPGMMIKSKTPVRNLEEAELIKARAKAEFGGGKRGNVGIVDGDSDVVMLGFNLQQLEFPDLRSVAESRVAAALGVPAVLVGLKVGLDRCLTADARVWTLNGAERIADIRPGRVVWSMVDGRLEPRTVTNWELTGHRTVYKLRTSNRTIKATDNHPFLVRLPGNSQGSNSERAATYAWKRVDELEVGDYIVQVSSLPDQGIAALPDGTEATPGVLQFFGALVGDGTVSPGVGIRVAMPPGDRCIETYRELAGDLFSKYDGGGQRPWKNATDGNTGQMVTLWQDGQTYAAIGRQFGLTKASVRDRIETVLHPKPVTFAPVTIQQRERDFGFSTAYGSRWCAALGLAGRAKTKRVPSWVFGLRRDLRLAFLAGLVDTDGSIDKRGVLSFSFANEALTHDVRDLLLSVGIQCANVYYRQVPGTALPNEGSHELYDLWTFVAARANQVADIPFSDSLYRERVNNNLHRTSPDLGYKTAESGLSAEFAFYRLLSIEEQSAEDVYDIEVQGGDSFIANGILVHNSTYNNFGTARQFFAETTLSNYWRRYSDQYTIDIAAEFGEGIICEFDTSVVRALAGQRLEKIEPIKTAWVEGAATKNEYREVIGLDPDPNGDVYRIPATWTEVPKLDKVRPPEPERPEPQALPAVSSPSAEASPPPSPGGEAPLPPKTNGKVTMGKGLDLLQLKAAPSEADPQDEDESDLENALKAPLAAIAALTIARIRAGQIVTDAEIADIFTASLQPALTSIATRRAIALGVETAIQFDAATVSHLAAEWAKTYSYEMVKGITATTQAVIGDAVANYLLNPSMTRVELEAILEPAFGAVRARMIASTETSRAWQAGMDLYREKLLADHGINTERVWLTRDLAACSICLPLNGQPEPAWVADHPTGPPIHVSCRCRTELRVLEAAKK